MKKEFPKRGDIYWITLDPTVGSEIQKTRPCIIISNNAQNKKSSRIIIAPVTSKAATIYSFEAKVTVKDRKGKTMMDQLRAVDNSRLGKYVTSLAVEEIIEIDKALKVALALN